MYQVRVHVENIEQEVNLLELQWGVYSILLFVLVVTLCRALTKCLNDSLCCSNRYD